MEVFDANSLQLLLGRCRTILPFQFRLERIPHQYFLRRVPLLYGLKVSPHPQVHSCLLKSSIMSSRKGKSSMKCQDLCKVLWCIEADLPDGELLYVTGDLNALGCWKPDMAVLFSPSAEQTNLWETVINVPCGLNFKYNYFIKKEGSPYSGLVWRPGPEFSLSVPHPPGENECIRVRDAWMTTPIDRLPVPNWGSWIEEMYPSLKPMKHSVHDGLSTGQCDMLRGLENGFTVGNDTLSLEKLKAENTSNLGPVEHNMPTERDQPVEEPWLLQSTLLTLEVTYDPVVPKEESAQIDDTLVKYTKKVYEGMETVPIEEETKTASAESVSTVILINSSVCTMQRIAVLEDEKLVELLLEPVKNNVQCDSVYLGMVTKLVPHMGGAFVDIGISRPSLMEIKQTREPFVYPPFNHPNDWKIKGSFVHVMEENPDVHVDGHEVEFASHYKGFSFNACINSDQGDSSAFLPDDSEEHDVEDEMDTSDTLKVNLNGSVLDYGGAEADFEDYYDENGQPSDAGTVNEFPPLEMQNVIEQMPDALQDVNSSHDVQEADVKKWGHVRNGTKVIVQVVKEGLGTKGPSLTAYPNLRSRFWILSTRCSRIGVSKKITGVERTRLRVIAKTLQPPGFGLTVRTVAAGRSLEELQNDLEGLLSTWKEISEHAKSAALAADEGVEGAVPVILHRAMGQTLSVVQDYFNEKVKCMIVDSPRTFHEVTNYLQQIAPDLCDRVKLHDKKIPIFDEYGIEEEINRILSKRVPLSNGGSLVIEQTEALVSIDVNGGHGMLGQETSQEKAVLDVNLTAAKQIARELRLRDIGGIIVVDFIDMVDDSNKRLVYEAMKKAVERDRSIVRVSELSKHGLMEITRKRVRPSVAFLISEPCTCCHATGRVEALETFFSKIEHEICRLLAAANKRADPENAKTWPRFVLRVDRHMCNYLTSGRRTKLALLCSSLKVWILLKIARGLSRGAFEIKPFIDEKTDGDQHEAAISRLRPTEAGSYVPNSKLTFSVKKRKSRGK